MQVIRRELRTRLGEDVAWLVAVALAAMPSCKAGGGNQSSQSETCATVPPASVAPPLADAGEPPCWALQDGGPGTLYGAPSTGGVGAWVPVDVTNMGLQSAANLSVTIGGVPAPIASFAVLSGPRDVLTVVVPQGATSGPFVLLSGACTAWVSPAPFVVLDVPAPIVASVTPSVASIDAGTVVTVTGQYFTGATGVWIGLDAGASAQGGGGVGFVVIDDGTIQLAPGSGPPGSPFGSQPGAGPVGVAALGGVAFGDAGLTVTP